MASVIWIDSDGEDDGIQFIENTTPTLAFQKRRNASAGPSSISGRTIKRQRPPSPDSDILEAPLHRTVKVAKLAPTEDKDRELALALQKEWDEDPFLAAFEQEYAAEARGHDRPAPTIESRLAALESAAPKAPENDQATIAGTPKKRRRVAKKKVPEDGIVFKVTIDTEGKTIDGEEDPDNAARLEAVKRDFEPALAAGLKIKTGIPMVCDVKLETRFEAAKKILNSHGIDSTERNLFHGTAETNIQPILENGFLIPGVSKGAKRARGSSCGVGVYLAESPVTSLGYTLGASRMFMCRVSQARPRPLGENGHESWTMAGGGVYVLKYVELVVPRYVVEFEGNAALQNFPFAPLGAIGMGGLDFRAFGAPGAALAAPPAAGLFGAAPPGLFGTAPAVAGLFGRMPALFAPPPPGLFGGAAPAPPAPFGAGFFGAPPAFAALPVARLRLQQSKSARLSKGRPLENQAKAMRLRLKSREE
ncbi:hypothetical protein B0H16DRAFT_1459177 [Mycena metata]|uniref:PARP catalytic domain-containing protein n=1 Tax=Mycena metata TaxID=1033252 RepID=A0AAD7J066_9AGAR|nr:hypothetical protein B0H16DRAFT_1459177 [Mycena metata]